MNPRSSWPGGWWWLPAATATAITLSMPDRGAGSIAAVVVAALLAVALRRSSSAVTWSSISSRTWRWIAIAVVAVCGVAVFRDLLTDSPDWRLGDWGIQRTVLAKVMQHIPGFHTPVWMNSVSTGDAPLETYPALAYVAAGHLAWITGLSDDIPRALMVAAVLVHVGLAIFTMRIAYRVATLGAAIFVAMVALLDVGALSGGGVSSLFRWGLFHHAFAQMLVLWSIVAVLDALHKPRTSVAVRIWMATALATAAHPAALLQAALIIVSLLLVAILANDVKPRRAIIALLHVVIGVALGAVAWLPMSERLLAYGEHFSTTFRPAGQIINDIVNGPVPGSNFAIVMMLGVVGLVVALWSRRASLVFVASFGMLAIVLLSNRLYSAFELTPSPTVVRLGVERFASIARPMVLVAAAYMISLLWNHVRTQWRGASGWRVVAADAMMGIMTLAVARHGIDCVHGKIDRAVDEAKQFAPDADSRDQLVAWARAQMAQLPPDKMARALIEAEDLHYEFNLVAETGMPVVHLSAIPNLMLRNRIQDASDESLRRFNIRWVIARGKDPEGGGKGEVLTLGRYRIREVASWDGAFARIEGDAGASTVNVTRLSDEAVDVELSGTESKLVALGAGYYPRWRATDASGDVAVIPVAASSGSLAHVVGAQLRPGVTHFTIDGSLPSDRAGWPVAGVALIVACAGMMVWRRPRWRWRMLRRVARMRRWIVVREAWWQLSAAVAITIVVAGWALRDCSSKVPAVVVGTGARSSATVMAKHGDKPWQTCSYSALVAVYQCNGLVMVNDGVATLLYDDAASWRFPTPAIFVVPSRAGVSVRIEMNRPISGTYWAASTGDTGTVKVGAVEVKLDRQFHTEFSDQGNVDVAIEVTDPPIAGWYFTMVRQDAFAPATVDDQ
jgi:hypothetical protein